MSKWSQKSFLKISENYTFESIILESVKAESVGVNAQDLCNLPILESALKVAVAHTKWGPTVHNRPN